MNSQKNTREFFVANSGKASESTLQAFQSGASTGEIGVFSADGTAAGAGKDFVVVVKTADGIIKSDVVKASTATFAKKTYSAPVERRIDVSDITVPATTGAKADYLMDIVIYNHGSLSNLNQYNKHGQYYFTQTGSLTASDVVDGMITNLKQNFSKEPNATPTTNPLFTFTKGYSTWTIDVDTAPDANGNCTVTIDGTATTIALLAADTDSGAATKIAAALTAVSGYTASAVGTVVTLSADNGIFVSVGFDAGTSGATAVTIAGTAATAGLSVEAKAQDIELGKKEGRQVEFDVKFKEATQTSTVETVNAGNPGVGSGKQVATLEYFYRGAYGDAYRGMGFPYTWPTDTKTLAEQSSLYGYIEISHKHEGDGLNKIELDKKLTLAIKDSSGSTTNIDAVETAVDVFI